jgi:hypothetical protein
VTEPAGIVDVETLVPAPLVQAAVLAPSPLGQELLSAGPTSAEDVLLGELAELQALRGAPGPVGPQGPPGQSADAYYLHTQSVPASVWHVVHGLGRYPSVTVIDSAGEEVDGEVVHLSVSALDILFSAPFSGSAACN